MTKTAASILTDISRSREDRIRQSYCMPGVLTVSTMTARADRAVEELEAADVCYVSRFSSKFGDRAGIIMRPQIHQLMQLAEAVEHFSRALAN